MGRDATATRRLRYKLMARGMMTGAKKINKDLMVANDIPSSTILPINLFQQPGCHMSFEMDDS